jgi:hypothetical protein
MIGQFLTFLPGALALGVLTLALQSRLSDLILRPIRVEADVR